MTKVTTTLERDFTPRPDKIVKSALMVSVTVSDFNGLILLLLNVILYHYADKFNKDLYFEL